MRPLSNPSETSLLPTAKLRTIISNIVLPRYQDTGRLRGYCLLTFKDAESKLKAKERNKQILDGRYLDITEPVRKQKITDADIKDMRRKITDDMRTVFVKNLPYDCTENEVGDFFGSCGKILNVRFVFNSVSGKFKGWGH